MWWAAISVTFQLILDRESNQIFVSTSPLHKHWDIDIPITYVIEFFSTYVHGKRKKKNEKWKTKKEFRIFTKLKTIILFWQKTIKL